MFEGPLGLCFVDLFWENKGSRFPPFFRTGNLWLSSDGRRTKVEFLNRWCICFPSVWVCLLGNGDCIFLLMWIKPLKVLSIILFLFESTKQLSTKKRSPWITTDHLIITGIICITAIINHSFSCCKLWPLVNVHLECPYCVCMCRAELNTGGGASAFTKCKWH